MYESKNDTCDARTQPNDGKRERYRSIDAAKPASGCHHRV
jgi:hypothetical protein